MVNAMMTPHYKTLEASLQIDEHRTVWKQLPHQMNHFFMQIAYVLNEKKYF